MSNSAFNSPDARPFPYEDIIDTPWPRPEDTLSETGRIHMPLDDRAKIFLPFAALKGFEEAIAERIRRAEEKNS